MPITIAIYGSLVIFMVNISYYNPVYINSLFTLKEIVESELLWPVDRVQKSLNGELQQINGADYFIFGHMMFDNIQTFANQIYIDTGSPNSGRLSFYKIK